jgi:hypothetical protein
MSAPPGWHLQPDGRERYWDGQQWTEQFRTPTPSDPTAPPADTGWSQDDRTQALGVDPTQAMPTPPQSEGYVPPPSPTYPTQQQYGYPSGGGGLPPAEGYGPTGYGTPGYGGPDGPYPPQKQGMSGTAKGCLIAAVVGLVLVIIVAVAGVWLLSRAANEAVEQIQTQFPTAVPTEVPTDLPTDLPTEIPELGGEPVRVSVGDGFDLPRASIAPGWTVEQGDFTSEVTGMTATYTEGQGLPVAFSMSFEGSGGDTVDTFCSAAPASDGNTTTEVSCIPLFGDVSASDQVTVTPAF